MYLLKREKLLLILNGLVEGQSIRSLERMTGVHRDTIMRWGVRAGEAAQKVHDQHVLNVKANFVQADEMWGYIGKKDSGFDFRGVFSPDYQGEAWTFVAIDAESKLIFSYLVGLRNLDGCETLLADVRRRVAGPFQLTTDGFKAYSDCQGVLGPAVDFGQRVKVYSGHNLIGTHTRVVMGNPHPDKINTSYVERSNLTTRMSIRRMTRKTSAFSKKVAHHEAALSLHFAHYNFCRWHRTLKTTPAMAAGLTDHPWTMEELVGEAFKHMGVA
jgi:IS1 family transposase